MLSNQIYHIKMILETVMSSEITILYLYSTYSTFGGFEYSSFWIIILLKGGVIFININLYFTITHLFGIILVYKV